MAGKLSSWRRGSGPRTKFGNVTVAKTESFDGRFYHSLGEHAHGRELSMLEKAGAISDLTFQVCFPLVVNEIHICDYIADFVYIDRGSLVVDDYKGVKTPEFKLKWALMKAVYPEYEYRLTKPNSRGRGPRKPAARRRQSPLSGTSRPRKRRPAG